MCSWAIHAHGALTAVIAVACMAIGFAVMRRALIPIDSIRRRLSAVQQGVERRLDGAYPAEVQPLVDDLNALLTHGEQAVARASAKAGDLAHGLKTPLAVLSNEAERLAANGDADLAATIAQQVGLMRRQVDYHLAHARAAASGTALRTRCPVAVSADGLARTMLRLHAQRGLAIDARIDPSHAFRGQREDLDEMLGNLLDNACKWARTRVSIESARRGRSRRSSRSTTMAWAWTGRCGRRCCSAACAQTRPRLAPGSASRSSGSWRRYMADRSR